MADPIETVKDVVHDAEDTVKDVIHEAEEGESARTPAIAITGVTLVLGVVVGVLIAALIVIYVLVR
jgi:hypothetical protein